MEEEGLQVVAVAVHLQEEREALEQ